MVGAEQRRGEAEATLKRLEGEALAAAEREMEEGGRRYAFCRVCGWLATKRGEEKRGNGGVCVCSRAFFLLCGGIEGRTDPPSLTRCPAACPTAPRPPMRRGGR